MVDTTHKEIKKHVNDYMVHFSDKEVFKAILLEDR